MPSNPSRELTDAVTMRTLAHPVRVRLLEALAVAGPLTATAAGEMLGESATTCSFHLRQLGRHGFVVEAGGGRGRQRPWRLTHLGTRLSRVHDDPEIGAAAAALERVYRERGLHRLREWLEARVGYPAEWQEAAGFNQLLLFVTAAERRELDADIAALLLDRYGDRLADPAQRPVDALPVEVLTFSYPVRPGSGA